MAVRLPKMHIATSVVNRILNTYDEINQSLAPAPAMMAEMPNVPDPTLEGANLDIGLETVVPEGAAAPADPLQSDAVGAALMGGDTADGVIANALQG